MNQHVNIFIILHEFSIFEEEEKICETWFEKYILGVKLMIFIDAQ